MPKHHLALLAAGLTVAAAGCGSDAAVPAGATINYGSFGTTAELDCADGKSLDVGGSNNTLRVGGTCSSVSVGGADNKITLERVDGTLSIRGLNNIVTYKSGEPDVSDEGSGNRINKG